MAGTTSDKLALLRQIKEAFRAAITGKGQTISNDEPFSAWPAKVTAIQTGTDTSDATATASDIASGATAYVNGEKITGNIETYASGAGLVVNAQSRNKSGSNLATMVTNSSDSLLRSGSTIMINDPLTNFGDATAADVAFGKTFTSSAGLKVTGTGAIETHTLSVIRKSNFSISYNGGQTKFEIEVPSMTTNSTILDFTAYIKYDNTGLGWIMFGLLPYNDTPIGICDTNANFSIEKCSITPGTDKVTILCEYSSVYDFLETEGLTNPSNWKDGGGFVVFQ